MSKRRSSLTLLQENLKKIRVLFESYLQNPTLAINQNDRTLLNIIEKENESSDVSKVRNKGAKEAREEIAEKIDILHSKRGERISILKYFFLIFLNLIKKTNSRRKKEK